METNKIPTAEEFLKEESGRWPRSQEVISSIMIEFAKLHVDAALDSASRNVCQEWDSDGLSIVGIDRKSILDSYPKNLIK